VVPPPIGRATCSAAILAAQRWPAGTFALEGAATGSAAILAAQRWPAGTLDRRAHARQGESLAAKMAALRVAPAFWQNLNLKWRRSGAGALESGIMAAFSCQKRWRQAGKKKFAPSRETGAGENDTLLELRFARCGRALPTLRRATGASQTRTAAASASRAARSFSAAARIYRQRRSDRSAPVRGNAAPRKPERSTAAYGEPGRADAPGWEPERPASSCRKLSAAQPAARRAVPPERCPTGMG
jgi:hypothetical protein